VWQPSWDINPSRPPVHACYDSGYPGTASVRTGPTIVYVIGTAGHVDHGKSTLVQALTGIDPDRLQEEKARGMTIDLGFAWLRLPGGEEISIVDVPGHERFIKNMLAGVGGIDLALLVVAADEGVMPQTREHLAIVDLLRIRSGVVAVTKRDLVDQDWLDLVCADVEETLQGTSLRDAPIVPCSAFTRDGLDTLLRTVEEQLASTPPKRDIGRPRLAIDRAFTIAGFGTVVTGTLIDGSLRVGQEIEVIPGGLRARVRGLQTHRQKVETARPGSRTAVNLTGLAVDDLHRGQVLTTPGWLAPTDAVDVSIQAVAELSHAMRHNATVTFHSGAAEVEAKARLLDRNELRAGESGWAQVRLKEPLALVRGDGYVLRSPNETLAGGVVVDTRAKRHRRFDDKTTQTLSTLAQGSPEEALFALIARLEPVTVSALVKQTETGEAESRRLVSGLAGAGRVVALGDPAAGIQPATLLFTAPGYESLNDQAMAALSTFFREHPLRSGMPKEELRSRLRLQARVFNDVLARWLRDELVLESGAHVGIPGREVVLSAAHQREADDFVRQLGLNRFAPAPDHAPTLELVAYLTEQGTIVPVADGVVFLTSAYAEMVDRITDHLRRDGTITLAQVRDMFGASRKYAQALLEHLDQRGVTRRVGDERVLR
jgi:selenocysteine-specific elongation factor